MTSLSDRLYGSHTICEPVLLELLVTPTVLRLHRLGQYGVPDRYYHLKNFSRYEHSVGVMLLLRHLGAPLEEQIAGLLHDVSHTAFSHVADWVVGTNTGHNFQDTNHEQYVLRSEIPAILYRYGFDPKKIVQLEAYPLLDTPAPALCADRIDYALREAPKKIATETVASLHVFNHEIAFSNKTAASHFAYHYMDRQMENWAEFEAINRYSILAKTVQRGFTLEKLSFDDLWTDDETVMKKIEAIDDPIIQDNLCVLAHRSLAKMPQVKGEQLYTKFRFVDPLFKEGNSYCRLCDVDETYKEMVAKARAMCEQGVPAVDTHAAAEQAGAQ